MLRKVSLIHSFGTDARASALGRVQYTGHSCIALACPICTGGTSAGRRRAFGRGLLLFYLASSKPSDRLGVQRVHMMSKFVKDLRARAEI